ncbi:MAG: hypothetical protein ACJ72A_24935, partial [Nocardioidaceae bacterium]
MPTSSLGDPEADRTDQREHECRDDVRVRVGAAAALDHGVGEPDQGRQRGYLADEVEGVRSPRRGRDAR